MGHADDFSAAALADHFAVFGQTWSYTPAGGEAADVVVIPGPEEVRHEDQGGKKTVRTRSLAVETADVTVATLQDAKFANATRSYSVERIERLSEDSGVVTVRVVHVEEAARARPALRDGPRW